MAGAAYGNVSIVVGDSNPDLCDAIRETFREEGLNNVETCTTAADLLETIKGKSLDLIVVDHSLTTPDTQELIQKIRRNAITENPFVAIIATVHAEAPASTKSLWDAGVDHVVAKPLTVDALFRRVSKLAKKREPFIVSPCYIGPSRRQAARPNARPSITRQTPNTLRGRLIDRMDEDEIARMVALAAARLGDDRFDSTAAEVEFLVTGIIAYFDNPNSPEEVKLRLQRLIAVSEAWRDDHDGAARDVIFELTGMLVVLAKRILDTSLTSRVVEVELLAQLAQAVRASLDIDIRETKSFEEITRIVARFTQGA
ncbi:MAG TPA: response regulator [Magnetospirillaceae bacterium]|jgi:CheY-like chemotaxis protein